VTDAFMRDIRCMVIRECVADRTPAVMDANLFDLQQKYAEVVPLTETLNYLASLSDRSASRIRSKAAG
jgi:maleamate amidohydrolase